MRFFLLVFAVLPSLALAGDVRDVQGRLVPQDRPQLYVAWSLDGADLNELARLASLGSVVAVNTDPPAAKSRILPFLHSHGLDVTAVADPDGEVRAQVGLLWPSVAVWVDGDVVVAFTDTRDVEPEASASR